MHLVHDHVGCEVSLLSEGFMADFASVWTFARVGPLVTDKSTALGERLVAVFAGVGFLSGVYSQVSREVPLLTETFGAEIALVRAIARVDPHVAL